MTAKKFQRIIIPVDGSEPSKKAAKTALQFAQDMNIPSITTMFVAEIPQSTYPLTGTVHPQWIETIKEHGMEYLNEIERMAEQYGLTIEKKVLEGIPDDEIIKEAGEHDLIIMGSKGISGVQRILMGSVSEKVLHHSTSPVMIIK